MPIELPRVTGPHHLTVIGGEPAIFHCHHYNVVLQQSIEDAAAELTAPAVLKDGAVIVAHAQLAGPMKGQEPRASLAFGAEYFRSAGFGLLDVSGLTSEGGRVVLRNSHYALGFRARRRYGERREPADFFACGFVEGLAAAAFGSPAGTYVAVETECAAATGADSCVLEVRRAEVPRLLARSLGTGRLPDPLPPREGIASAVDEAKIIGALSRLSLAGNEEGLIPAFGVYLSRHYANYYNFISYEFLRRLVERAPSLVRAGESLLVEAGHVCAFNTFGGIMESPEWDAIVRPMLRERSDWVFGITACINALGWGRWSVKEIVDDRRLVMRIDAPYEANYYKAAFGESAEPRCYFARGAVAGIMNLLYTGDIASKPALSYAYYDALFSGPQAFVGRQEKCPTMGDAYCEIVAERASFRG